MSRSADLDHFYDLLTALEEYLGGKRCLGGCNGRMDWPERGVYFFFEPGEARQGRDLSRVVRVGTHALKSGSRTTLWNRLSQHRGVASTLGGNHRGSIFRLLMGMAIRNREGVTEPASWGSGADIGQAARRFGVDREEVRIGEDPLEQKVSTHVRTMPFLWLAVDDPPGPDSERGLIERNSIALLSNYHREAQDAPSDDWLGRQCDRQRVRLSGLWNNNHVDEAYDGGFLRILERRVADMRDGG